MIYFVQSKYILLDSHVRKNSPVSLDINPLFNGKETEIISNQIAVLDTGVMPEEENMRMVCRTA